MNNKGFAITGILYTIFILFMLIIGTILANMSFKNRSLSLATNTLETSFKLVEVEPKTAGYQKVGNTYFALYDGKYTFTLTYTELNTNETKTLKCSTYLKKGDKIPTLNDQTLGNSNPAKDFVLMPDDCNKYYYDTIFEGNGGEHKMLLEKIYKFKERD